MAKQWIKKLVLASIPLFAAIPAQAASYSLTLDPAFGSQFPLLDWSASGLIDAPDSCLAGGNGNYDISTCAGLKFTSMTVSFIDNTSDTVVQTFDVLTQPVTIYDYTLIGNQLTGIDAGFFTVFKPTAPAAQAIAGGGAYSFSLFISQGAVTGDQQVSNGSLSYWKAPATSPLCTPGNLSNGICGVSENLAVGVITPVPEPQTYALMLAGLAAVGFVTRRCRQS